MSYQQQYTTAAGYQPPQPQGFQQGPAPGPAWQQQQQQQQQSFNPNQPRPGFPPGASGGMQQSQYTPQQQQQMAAAMIAQRQQLQAAQQGQGGQGGQGSAGPGTMGPPSIIPGMGPLSNMQGLTREQQQQAVNMMHAQQAAIQQQRMQEQAGGAGGGGGGSAPSHKKKKAKLPPPQQMIPRQPPPPRTAESFRQTAMASTGETEPWADALDEVDPRELAMGRFRARQETLAEIFSPDSIKDILAVEYDPWSGLGTDAATLEEKVLQLEKENEGLSARMDGDVEAFRKRLADAEGVEVETIEVPS